MDDRWLGESTGGFTEFLRLEDDPDVVRSIALDLAALPRNTSDAVLRAIGLPLQPAMTEEAILATLGQPTSVEQFPSVPDRRTLNFVCGTREAYTVSCTVHEASGLIYVVVMTPTPRRFST